MTIPQGICSKCHEDFMNCKCEQFHPNVQLKVEVYCNSCSEFDDNNDEISKYEMKLDGPLYFNTKTKSQCQSYRCESCNKSVSVIIR